MSLLGAEKLPAVLVLLMAIAGFYITDVAEEIRAGPTLTYRVDNLPDGSVQVRIENISRSAVLQDIKFDLLCNNAIDNCFRMRSSGDGTPPEIDHDSPLQSPLAGRSSVRGAPDATTVSVTLVPSAVVKLTLQRSEEAIEAGASVLLVYTPDQGNPAAVTLFAANNPTALFIGQYLDVMILVFAASAAVLVVALLVSGLSFLWQERCRSRGTKRE